MRIFFLMSTLCMLVGTSARALDVPSLRGHVNDLAGLLDSNEANKLEEQLYRYEQATQHQFVLLTIDSLEDENIESYSLRVVEAWKLGRQQNNDGLLMLIALKERKMRIEVGYGLEGDIPDALCAQIIRNVLKPAFKQQQFYHGINQAFDLLERKAQGEAIQLPKQTNDLNQENRVQYLFLILIALFILSRFFGGGGGGGFLTGVLLGMPWGRGMGGRGGGGGFSGGGGNFGGGGSSGDW